MGCFHVIWKQRYRNNVAKLYLENRGPSHDKKITREKEKILDVFRGLNVDRMPPPQTLMRSYGRKGWTLPGLTIYIFKIFNSRRGARLLKDSNCDTFI